MFNDRQVKQLLAPIHQSRVMHANGQSHVSQQDVRAHLTRLFGFGNWSKEVLRLEPVSFVEDGGRFTATYLVHLRLTVWNADRSERWATEDVATGSAQRQKSPGDAHDLAAKAAVSYALKRCATDLGDQFGLSLYNKGQTAPLVIRTMVMPEGSDVVPGEPGDAQEGVPQQVSLGLDDDGSRASDGDGTAGATGDRVASRIAASPEGEGVPCKDCALIFQPSMLRNGQCRDCWTLSQPPAPAGPAPAAPAADATAGEAPAPAKKAAKRAAAAAPPAPPVEPVPAEGWPAVKQPGSGGVPGA